MSAETTTERNQRRLREASQRLLSGQARVSDGKLSLTSLAAEAGVPRPYLYRDPYKSITDGFEEQAGLLLSRSGSPDERLAEIERLRRELGSATASVRDRRQELRRARDELHIAASQVAYLSAQNDALREQLRVLGTVSVVTRKRSVE